MKVIFFVLVLLCSILNGKAQHRTLSIGDTLPPLVLRSIINSPDTSIDLGKLKFKLLLVDFWAADCGSCYYSLAKVDSFQKQFAGITAISVTKKDSDSILLARLRKIPVTRNIQLPVLTYDTLLHAMFPHELITHIIWIDSNRVVRGITGSDYLTKEKVQQALNNEMQQWPVKVDFVDFDYKQSVLTYVKELPPPLYPLLYSGLTRFIDGIAPPFGIYHDSAHAAKRFSIYNLDVVELCKIVLRIQLRYRPFSIRLRVKNRWRFERPSELPVTDWLRQYGYCFFLSTSLDTPDDVLRNLAAKDLRVWLERAGVRIRLLKTKPTPLYEIVETSSSN